MKKDVETVMRLQYMDKEVEERRPSAAETDRKEYTQQAVPPHLQTRGPISGNQDRLVLPHVIVTAVAITVVHFLMMLVNPIGITVLDKLGLVNRDNLGFWTNLFGQITSIISVLGMGYVIGKIVTRRAIVPGIVLGSLLNLVSWFLFVLPSISRVFRGTIPGAYWAQVAIGTVLGGATLIAVALFVSRRRTS